MPTVHIVYAHLESASFNAALLDTAKTTLEGQGHKVIVSDLYKMNFNPVISKADRTDTPSNPDHFKYDKEMGYAMDKGTLAKDILEEQTKVSEADLLIFQFPMQWFSMPGIMKGWMERVFLENFAFAPEKGQLYENGLLKGKKAVLSLTTGGARGYYTPSGLNGDIDAILHPPHGTLRFVGLSVLKPFISYNPITMPLEGRKELLKSWADRLLTVFDEKPIYFPPLSEHRPTNGDFGQGMELPDDYRRPGDEAGVYGASVVQHMGRRVPTDDSVPKL